MATRLPSIARHLSRHHRSSLPRTSTRLSSSSPFQNFPSPPRLPAEQQAEFERLQHVANTQAPLTAHLASPAKESAANTESLKGEDRRTLGEVSNLPLRKGAPPEFEGEMNPKTGEVGGPKNEPLRWGSAGDWSYNGRVTDF